MVLKKLFQKGLPFSGAKGLVFIGGDNILIYQRDGNTTHYPFYLDMPGGGSEPGETPFETFQRELMEEFGLNIDMADISYASEFPTSEDPSASTVGYFLVGRLGPEKIKDIKFGDEGTGYSIMPLEDYLAQPNIMPAHREQIQKYLKRAPLAEAPFLLA